MESQKEIPQITPTAAHRQAVRYLVRSGRSASLATMLEIDGQHHPYASLVTYATDADGSPLFLLSTLADHTRALLASPQASLLIEQASHLGNPQTGPRVTLIGTMEKVSREEERAAYLRGRFLATHPAAAQYEGFGDFSLWRMSVSKAHYVGGFARAVWLGNDWLAEKTEAIAVAAGVDDALTVMSAAQKASVAYAVLMAANHSMITEGDGWRLSSADCDGVTVCDGEAGPTAWLPFGETLGSAQDIAKHLYSLADLGRQIALEQALKRT